MDGLKICKKIGAGAFGSCYVVKSTSGEGLYVQKVILLKSFKDEKDKNEINLEVELLSKLTHPNVVKYERSWLSKKKLNILMEYCEGGDLRAHIEASKGHIFPESQIIDWFVQITLGVKYIHSQKILHRDLKSSNIFITKDNIAKIGDFGIAKVLSATLDQATTVVGTPYYMSPEVCENKPYSYKSDVWALGCILQELCTGEYAFSASNLLSLAYKIVTGSPKPIPTEYSPGLQDLVSKLLTKDP